MMKTFFIFSILPILAITLSDIIPKYDITNSESIVAKEYYQKDSMGIYQMTENVPLEMISNISPVAYDKKQKQLYALSENALCVITVRNNAAKIINDDKTLPKLKGDKLRQTTEWASDVLAKRIRFRNQKRMDFIQDSIREDSIREAERFAKLEREVAQRKAQQQDEENYRKAHSGEGEFRLIPTNKISLFCLLCNKSYCEDYAFGCYLNNDTLVYLTKEYMFGAYPYTLFHTAIIPKKLKSDDTFKLHVGAFGDSLKNQTFRAENVELLNDMTRSEVTEKVIADCPYGFISDWGWNDKYGCVTFFFHYTNVNKKTIKYVDVYWKITNDVNDVRKTGHFKGTGPVEQYETASWNWDYSSYYVAGDATQMKITKVILTYMNGTQKVLTNSQLKIFDE